MVINRFKKHLLRDVAFYDNQFIEEYIAIFQACQTAEDWEQNIDHTASLDPKVAKLGVHEFY